LVGQGRPGELVRRLMLAGGRVLSLRMGRRGSLVVSRSPPLGARVPAVPVNVVDPVGAGNAFCGGFLAGWVQTGNVIEAGLRGAVAASFVLEQVGVPAATPAVRQSGVERLAALRARVRSRTLTPN
jgi:sugar/nucleoside kinase (ribokinase family)